MKGIKHIRDHQITADVGNLKELLDCISPYGVRSKYGRKKLSGTVNQQF